MIRSLVTTAVKTTAVGGIGSAFVGGASAAGTIATIVAAPWFLPAAILTGVVLGGLKGKSDSEKEIDNVNRYFE